MNAGKSVRVLGLLWLVFYLSACDAVALLQSKLKDDAEQAYLRYVQQLTKAHIQPAYRQLHQASTQLNRNIQQACATPSAVSAEYWQASQHAWRQTMAQWQQIQWLKLGPVAEANLGNRIQFWPDSNDAVERGVTRLLQSPEMPSPERMARINVGAQGLPAMERLLFSTPQTLSADSEQRCLVLQAIAANLQSITEGVDRQWHTSNSRFVSALTSGTGEFSGAKDATEELLSNGLAQLVVILDNKLSYPMAFAAPGIPALAESPFADESLNNLRHNLSSLHKIYTGDGGYGLDDMLAQRQHQALSAQITTEFQATTALMAQLPDSYQKALADEQQRSQLLALVAKLRVLQKLLAEDMVSALSLNLGFNALDGD